MNLLDIILLAIALAMDCFAVSIVSGVLTQKRWLPRMAILWIGISFFRQNIEAYDHWIAFALLFLIGGNMIRESFSPEEEHFFNPLRLRTQLLLAVATSIDAMAIGISFACTGFNEISQLLLPIIIIGIVSSLFSTIGTRLGARFGRAISHRLKPELLGGLILIAIGIKILITHLIEES